MTNQNSSIRKKIHVIFEKRRRNKEEVISGYYLRLNAATKQLDDIIKIIQMKDAKFIQKQLIIMHDRRIKYMNEEFDKMKIPKALRLTTFRKWSQ